MRTLQAFGMIVVTAVIAIGCATTDQAMFRVDAGHQGVADSGDPAGSTPPVWQYDADAPSYSSPMVDARHVFFGDNDGRMHALDRETGERIWHYDAEGNIEGTPAVADGQLYFGAWDGVVRALDIDSGRVVWEHETDDRVYSSPTIDNERVYIGTGDGRVLALERASGDESPTRPDDIPSRK